MTARRILVVDDDGGMVATLCDILELHGWETLRAYDGEAAVRIATETDVGVVLMDVRMPHMNGVDALRAIKRHRPSTRVVLMTAYARHEMLAQAQRDGALVVLRKPLELARLLALLRDAAAGMRSVLVVDDDAASLASLADVLRARGVATTQARTIDQALTSLERDAPSAVLLHLRRDGVDARTSIVTIKELHPSVPLILYGGHRVELESAVAAAPEGFVAATFTKPVVMEDLLAVLGAGNDA